MKGIKGKGMEGRRAIYRAAAMVSLWNVGVGETNR